MELLISAVVMFVLAAGFAVALNIANQKLRVEVDPRITAIDAALPQVNCGGCGYPGCAAYAEAIVKQGAPIALCGPGGPAVAAKIAAIMGLEVGETYRRLPVVHCSGTYQDVVGRPSLNHVASCAEADVAGQAHPCAYGCFGLSDCVDACPYNAMYMKDGLPVIDYNLCTSCGACARACPRGLIELIPFKADRMMIVACQSNDPGSLVRQICAAGCIGCSACARASDLFEVKTNCAKIDYGRYDPARSGETVEAGAAKCPVRVIAWVGPRTSLPQKRPKPAPKAAATPAPAAS